MSFTGEIVIVIEDVYALSITSDILSSATSMHCLLQKKYYRSWRVYIVSHRQRTVIFDVSTLSLAEKGLSLACLHSHRLKKYCHRWRVYTVSHKRNIAIVHLYEFFLSSESLWLEHTLLYCSGLIDVKKDFLKESLWRCHSVIFPGLHLLLSRGN